MGHRALAVHPGALGDVLLAVPALRALRERHGAVTLAAQPRIAALVHALGVVDEACALDWLGLDALFVDDAACGRLPDVDRIVCWLGARDPDFTRRLSRCARSVTVAPSVADGLVWLHLLDTAAPGARPATEPVAVPAPLREAGRAMLERAGWDGRRRLWIVHPGAGGAGKRWSAQGFARVLATVAGDGRVAIAVHRGPADADAAAALVAHLAAPLVLEDPALPALAGAMAHAERYLGNDSGVSHLAATLGVTAVVLFRDDNVRWAPWGASAMQLVVDVPQLRPADESRVVAALTGGGA